MSGKWNNEQDEMKTAETKIAEIKTAVEEPPAPASPSSEPAAGGVFTRYVRAIAERGDEVGGDAVGELCADLRKALVRELRWRSLWSGSPAYAGVLGWPSWTPGDTGGTASPLDDLLSDCYLFIFGRQLRRLLNQLRVRERIDGLVVVYLRQFLTERQKHHDPLGYRLFEILCTAVRGSVATGELHVLRGTPAIRNQTVLGATPGADPARPSPAGELLPLVARWNDALLPDLITAERAARRKVTESLQGHLAGLEAEGVTVFLFKDLLDALKRDVRARWGRLLRQQAGETVVEEDDDGVRRLVEILRPETRVEDLDSFKKLVRCVSNLIPEVDTRRVTRAYLGQLWNFLRRWSVGVRETLPSNRALASELAIPRERFPGLYRKLGELTRRCQGTLSGSVVEIDAGRHHAGSAGGHSG